jgi:hypothetical protein
MKILKENGTCNSNSFIYLQELKDKEALLKQQQELLRVAQEQKVSKSLHPTTVMWNLLWTKWQWDRFFS